MAKGGGLNDLIRESQNYEAKSKEIQKLTNEPDTNVNEPNVIADETNSKFDVVPFNNSNSDTIDGEDKKAKKAAEKQSREAFERYLKPRQRENGMMIRIPENVHKRLKKLSQSCDVAITTIIANMLEDTIKRNESQIDKIIKEWNDK